MTTLAMMEGFIHVTKNGGVAGRRFELLRRVNVQIFFKEKQEKYVLILF